MDFLFLFGSSLFKMAAGHHLVMDDALLYLGRIISQNISVFFVKEKINKVPQTNKRENETKFPKVYHSIEK